MTYEFEYILDGGGSIVVNDVRYPATEGTLFIRTPGMIVQGFPPYHSYCIIWDDQSSSAQSVFDQYAEGRITQAGQLTPCSLSFPHHHPVQALFRTAYQQYLTNDPATQLSQKATVLQILYLVVSYEKNLQVGGDRTSSAQAQRLARLQAYIDSNIGRRFTLAELAEICSVSGGSMCRLFRRAYGTTLFTHVIRCRMKHARRLLIETDLPVKAIGMQCGFENDSYFFRQFKREMNVSPLVFRKMHREPYDGSGGIIDLS